MSTAGGGREKNQHCALGHETWSHTLSAVFFCAVDKMFFIQLDKNSLKIRRFV